MDESRIYIESMTRLVDSSNKLTCRCWRQENSMDFNDAQNKHEISDVLSGEFPTAKDAAKAVLELDRVNAVEIIDVDGNGIVLYKDWP